ncbi:MAG: hypothetical protein ACLSA0_23270 [Eisenbergiella massiliensis]
MPFFEGEEDADYDTWLSCFYEMRSAWQEGNTEKAESLYEDLGKTGISHPYAAAVYAAVLVQKDKKGRGTQADGRGDGKDAGGSLAEGYCRTGQAGGGRRGRRLPGFPGGA